MKEKATSEDNESILNVARIEGDSIQNIKSVNTIDEDMEYIMEVKNQRRIS